MPKYVDVDKVVARLDEHYETLGKKYGFDDMYVRGYGEAINDMEDEPESDVQEVKHGHWELIENMKHYFIVSRSLNEYRTIDVAIREKFEDAKEVIKTISNWCENIGSGYIREIDENFRTIQRWTFSKNRIVRGPSDEVYFTRGKTKKVLEEGEQ